MHIGHPWKSNSGEKNAPADSAGAFVLGYGRNQSMGKTQLWVSATRPHWMPVRVSYRW